MFSCFRVKISRFGFDKDVKNSEPPRTAVVPRSSDVLKQSNLQSFKTRKFGFDMDVKTKPLDSFYYIVSQV
ncbi:hypothetical protein FUT84_01015 [Treponema phagedenis]|nr:hypothetical protein FUT84_01015 [Treponema phagedenis]